MPDQFGREECGAWIKRATADLRSAKVLTDAGEYPEALFHCQQAVEKALKAFLTYHHQVFRKAHDLSDLIAKCLLIDDSLSPTMNGVDDLTQYAWLFRYPGAPQDPEPADAASGFAKAELVLREIGRRIGV
jgi:HEPN domain-containing protein